jgi:hypothetical protein
MSTQLAARRYRKGSSDTIKDINKDLVRLDKVMKSISTPIHSIQSSGIMFKAAQIQTKGLIFNRDEANA